MESGRGKSMKKNTALGIKELAIALEKIPVGITIIDLDGHILYYNEYCSQYVDRKPEYIGKNIRSCHQKKESIKKLDNIFSQIVKGKIQEYYYESKRNGSNLGVRVSPFNVNGKLVGFIQSFSILR